MTHEKKCPKSTAKKARGQMIRHHGISRFKAKPLRDATRHEASPVRHVSGISYEREENTSGGPIDMGDQEFSQAMRAAKEVNRRPASPTRSDD